MPTQEEIDWANAVRGDPNATPEETAEAQRILALAAKGEGPNTAAINAAIAAVAEGNMTPAQAAQAFGIPEAYLANVQVQVPEEKASKPWIAGTPTMTAGLPVPGAGRVIPGNERTGGQVLTDYGQVITYDANGNVIDVRNIPDFLTGDGGGAGPTWTAYDQALLEAKQLETRILAGTLSRQLALDEYDAKMKDWEARFSAYESQQVLAQERQERARKILQDVLPYSSPGLKGVQVSSLGYMPTQKLNLNQLLGPPAAAAPVPPELSLPGVDLAAILGGV